MNPPSSGFLILGQAVEELLGAMHVSGALMVPVPSWHYEEPTHEAPRAQMPLQEALTKCYDLRQGPRHPIFISH